MRKSVDFCEALLVFSQGLEEDLGLWWSVGLVFRGRNLDLGARTS